LKLTIDKKIGLLLLMMTLIAAVNLTIVYKFLSSQRYDSHIINIAGRQRMLSQRIARLVLTVAHDFDTVKDIKDNDREELLKAIKLYETSLNALNNGGEILGLTIPKSPKSMSELFKKNWEIWLPIKKSAEIALKEQVLHKGFKEAVDNIKVNTDNLLHISNEVTVIYESFFVKKIVFLKKLLFVMLFVDILIIIIGWILANAHIVRPLKYLSKTAVKIGKGDFNQKIEIKHTDDEIGELANSFNAMLGDLKNTTVSKKFVENIIASMMNSLIVVYPDGTISQVNQATLNLLGYKDYELLGKPFSMILGNWELLKRNTVSIGDLLKDGDLQSEEQSYITKDGRKLPVLFANSVMLKDDGGIQGIVCVAQDITDIKEAEMELKLNEEKFRSITTAANDAIILMDDMGIMTYCNHAVSTIFGYKCSDLVGKDLHLTLAPERYHEDFKRGFAGFKKNGHGEAIGKTMEFTGKNNNGIEFPVEISLASFRSADKLYALGIIRDITVRKQMEEELKLLATTDRLTGAFNRLKFDDIIAIETARAKRYKQPLSLLMFDIDKFKNVNDTFGHDTGDEVLKVVASLIKTNIRKMDYFFRWGGEEFILVVPETNVEGAKTFAENIRKIIQDYTFNVVKKVTISIGVSQFKNDDTADVLIKRADEALYVAKENGRNRVEVNLGSQE